MSTVADGRSIRRPRWYSTLRFELKYSGLAGRVRQSHIHRGQRGTTGGIGAFLCSNLGNGPAGVQACPDTAGSVQGVIRAHRFLF